MPVAAVTASRGIAHYTGGPRYLVTCAVEHHAADTDKGRINKLVVSWQYNHPARKVTVYLHASLTKVAKAQLVVVGIFNVGAIKRIFYALAWCTITGCTQRDSLVVQRIDFFFTAWLK